MSEDFSYWLSYGKSGKRVLVTVNGVDDDGNDTKGFFWVDLDREVAEPWDFVKRYDEANDIS